MGVSREYMISELKKHKDKFGNPYSRCRVPGGVATLEQAPDKNIYAMYMAICVTGRKKKEEKLYPKEKQLEFNF